LAGRQITPGAANAPRAFVPRFGDGPQGFRQNAQQTRRTGAIMLVSAVVRNIFSLLRQRSSPLKQRNAVIGNSQLAILTITQKR
jgi:hypothetical protein